ncbi:MAG: hypothetical protein ACJ73D_05615 [Pyrinomonadaceae bacterium]
MFGLFKSKPLTNPRCAVVSIGGHDRDKLDLDKEIYCDFANVTAIECSSVSALAECLEHRPVDILHLLTEIGSDETIQGESKTAFLEQLSLLGPKILILASDNDAQSLIAFCSKGPMLSLNLVMTLDRKGEAFANFFKKLFILILGGRTMPDAWAHLSPQMPGENDLSMPGTIFSAGNGGLRIAEK